MTSTFVRGSSTWFCYSFIAFYSFFINSMGAITPLLKSDLGLSYTLGGLHYTAFALGIIGTGLLGDLAVGRLGRRRSIWIGSFGLSLGVAILVLGRTPFATIPASFVMGLLGSLILIAYPPILAERHGELLPVAISEANVIASSVAAVSPFLLGASTGLLGDWRPAPALVALAPLAFLMAFRGELSTAFRPKGGDRGAAVPAGAAAMESVSRNASEAEVPRGALPGGTAGSAGGLPRIYWAYWACIFLAVSAEFGMISWASDFMASAHGLDKSSASETLSLFLVAMILGRAADSALARRFGTFSLLGASIAVAMGGFLLFWLSPGAALSGAGLFLTGLGISSLYPLLLSLAIGASGGRSVRASSVASLASGLAIMCLPLLLARLADVLGIKRAYSAVPFVLVALAAIVSATAASSRVRDRSE
jgi:MFS family permease